MMDVVTKAKTKGLVLDGAMSTALEAEGINTDNPLWTGVALINDLKKVYQVHYNYFKAGADLTITDTYQANVQAFEKAGYTEKQADQFIKNAVKIAKKARDDYEKATGKHNYVAATIGSYGAYLADGNEYRGDYHLTTKQYLAFHLPRLKLMLSEKPDLIAIETQPKLEEPVAILDWLTQNSPSIPVYVSFTLHDAKHISDGTSLKDAITKINQYKQVFSIGINCIKPDLVTLALEDIQQYTDKPLVVYPNLGASYNPQIKKWQSFKKKYNFKKLAQEWYRHDAKLIGGCCTTGPKQIKQIASFYREKED